MDNGAAKREAIREAYRKLPEDEREMIDALAQVILDALKGRSAAVKVSLESVRELIFSTWIWVDKFERGIK